MSVVVLTDSEHPERDGFYEELPDGTLRRLTAWRAFDKYAPYKMPPPPSAEAE